MDDAVRDSLTLMDGRGIYYDTSDQSYWVIPNDKATYIKISGARKKWTAMEIANLVCKETPADIKKGWY